MKVEEIKKMVIAACDAIIASEPSLTEIDRKIGDGDHGTGMALGMKTAKEALLAKGSFETVNDVFKTAGMAMLNSMGGASGVIFGSFFLGGIKGKAAITELDGKTFQSIMEGSLDAIKKRGGAGVGDKTMVDALEPAVMAMKEKDSGSMAEMMEAAATAAAEGVEATKQQIAKFGRAQYLGERAIGFQDAGATSVLILFRAMSDYLRGQKIE